MQSLGSISIPNKHHKKEEKEQTLTLITAPHAKRGSNRPNKVFFRNNKYIFLILLIFVLIGWIYFVPPSNSYAVVPFIIVLTCIFSILASHFPQKIHVFSTLFMLLFLLMSYFIGFDIINTLVLLSFIIGLSTLFRPIKIQ